jgi:DNA-binding response OmpR family regulator
MANKILIADDSKLVVSLVKNIFENEQDDFIVISAVDGKDAIDKAEKELPDIILMDWQMPEMSGIEALKLLKKNEKTKSIPVLMLTASESTNEAFEFGAYDFIQKPFNKTELVARVANSLELVNTLSELKLKSIDLEIQHNKLKIQKDILVKQKKELTESHEIALKISQIISPEQNYLERFFSEFFFLSLPINEIQSNFIWASKHGKVIFICLGFISNSNISTVLLSSGINNVLNTFVNENEDENDLQPAKILTILNEKFKSETEQINFNKRCSDIVFCSLDLEKRSMQYSGINVPIFIIKNNKLVELKTDKNEIGISEKNIKFTNHRVQLAKGDLIYILNDGFNESKTVLTKSSYISDEIINVLNKIYTKDMAKQKELFEKAFKLWKKDIKQVNDILALGIKV